MHCLPLFSLTNEIEEIGDLLRLDIFPRCFQDALFQIGSAFLDSSSAPITDQDHNVAQNAASPLFNQCRWSWTALNGAGCEMGILAEWEEQF
jgi:hypothetical protein